MPSHIKLMISLRFLKGRLHINIIVGTTECLMLIHKFASCYLISDVSGFNIVLEFRCLCVYSSQQLKHSALVIQYWLFNSEVQDLSHISGDGTPDKTVTGDAKGIFPDLLQGMMIGPSIPTLGNSLKSLITPVTRLIQFLLPLIFSLLPF